MPQPPVPSLLVWGLSGLILLVSTITAYRIYFHPLSRVPGPKLAAVTTIWQAYQVWRGRLLAPKLHARYGPVVRISPNEVIFNTKEAHEILYRAGSTFRKSDFYRVLKVKSPCLTDWLLWRKEPDALDLLPEMNMPRYKLQRRLIGPTYSSASMKKHGVTVGHIIERFVEKLKALDGAEVDLEEWLHILAVECISTIVFSDPIGAVDDGHDHGLTHQSYFGMWRAKSVSGLFPWLTFVTDLLPPLKLIIEVLISYPVIPGSGFKWLFKFVYQHLEIRTPSNGQSEGEPKDDLFHNLVRLNHEKPEFNPQYLRGMTITNFAAGHETVTAALTSVLANTCTRPAIKNHLYEEANLRETDPKSGESTGGKYTQACFREALRLFPVVGMGLQRVVPQTGLSLHGYNFPPGAIVGCNSWALHRNKDLYGHDAGEFRPERWLKASPDQAKLMNKVDLTFGGANRTCPGRHMGELIVLKTVPILIREFDIEVSVPGDLERLPYYFMSMITGVKARFRARASHKDT